LGGHVWDLRFTGMKRSKGPEARQQTWFLEGGGPERVLEGSVGRAHALALIRNQRLYRQSFKTFEDYCLRRWQYARAYAYRLIGAAETMRVLSPMGDIPLPANERPWTLARSLDGSTRPPGRVAGRVEAHNPSCSPSAGRADGFQTPCASS